MTNLIAPVQVVKQRETIQKQETPKILCLDDPADDDLHKIYSVESESIKGKYYRVIASSFGANSCDCIDQTRNPYQSCKHMKVLDEMLEQSPESIQQVRQIL